MIDIKVVDALTGMESPEGGAVSAVVTDPPYCSGGLSETGRLTAKRQGTRSESAWEWFDGDNMGSSGLSFLMRAIAVQANRSLVPGGSLVVFCDWRMHAQLAPAIESAGLLHRGLVVWDKGSMGLGNGFRPQHELAMHFSKGKLEFHAQDCGNVIRARRVHGSRRIHPCEKPVELLAEIVRVVSPAGGLVVDPFMGSGATGAAAVSLGRRFLGFEVSPAIAESARRRLAGMSAEGGQSHLFSKEPA